MEQSAPGAFISRKFAEENYPLLKEVAFAAIIKAKYRNSCVYNYNPYSLAREFGMNKNTVNRYVSALLKYGIARMHNGNLCVGALKRSRGDRNGIRVSGSIKEIVSQIRIFIVDTNIERQKKAIEFKKGLKTAALGATLRNIKRVKRYEKKHDEIESMTIDEKVRVTISSIMRMLGINSRDAVRLRQMMIGKGYGFSYQTTVIDLPAWCVSPEEIPGNAYIHKGRIFSRDSWVNV